MSLNPDRRPVPDLLETDRFVVRRRRLDDAALDLEAVMDSRLELRDWSASGWPEDDFTAEANVADLRLHVEEHEHDVAYGFSVFEPGFGRLLASVYVDAVPPLLETRVAGPDVVREVLAWLRAEWWFGQVVFGSRPATDRRRALYEALGFQPEVVLAAADGSRAFHLRRP